jgi:membrane-bound lytic murein transglycosylase B
VKRAILLLVLALLVPLAVQAKAAEPAKPAPYSKRPEVRAYIRELVARHGFVEKELVYLFSRVRREDAVLQAIAAPAEKVRTWEDYRQMLVNERRIAGGAAFWKAHQAALARAERDFGVPAEYVVAIIGVETQYGRNVGKWRVIDALSTLAFDYPPRADFFRDELTSYLLLSRDEGINVFATRGSYAGAFGIPQFMPGSARRYAVDFDGSGSIDLHRSPSDAVGSVANFLHRHGWQNGGDVLLPARVQGDAWRAFADGSLEPRRPLIELLRAGVEVPNPAQRSPEEKAVLLELTSPGGPSEFRVGLQNFYVLTRYNRSAFYATAAFELAQAVKQRVAEDARQEKAAKPQEEGK